MTELVIFGTGDFAQQAHYYLSTDSPYTVAAFSVSREWIRSDSFLGLPLVPFESVETVYPPSQFDFFVPMSGRKMNRNRERFFFEAKAKGYRLASYISSRAILCDNVIGENCFILEGANIQPFATIGDNTVIWCSTHVGHHAAIGRNVFVCTGVVISGRCRIGDNSYLSSNCVIDANLRTAEGTLAGIASVVTRSTEPWSIYTGHPARKRKRSSLEFDFLK